MAPNQKSLSALVQTLSNQDLAALRNAVQPKYLPLTHPSEANQQVESKAEHPPRTESWSYWGWESEPQPTVCILSTDNMVSNLIANAQSCKGERRTGVFTVMTLCTKPGPRLASLRRKFCQSEKLRDCLNTSITARREIRSASYVSYSWRITFCTKCHRHERGCGRGGACGYTS